MSYPYAEFVPYMKGTENKPNNDESVVVFKVDGGGVYWGVYCAEQIEVHSEISECGRGYVNFKDYDYWMYSPDFALEADKNQMEIDYKDEVAALKKRIKALEVPNEKMVEAIARAFWRRIEPFKDKHGKELQDKLPIEFQCHMGTALTLLKRNLNKRD